jgi:glycosyltransferase involved in cell wall biosynthesis
MLRVVQISFFTDPRGRPAAQLLKDWPTLVEVAEAANSAGLSVNVVQASQHSETLTQGGVRYHLLPFGQGAQPARWDLLVARLTELAPDVLHVQGLDFPRDVLALARLMPEVPILLQDHASQPAPLWRRGLSQRGLAAATGVAFCCLEQARPFQRWGLLRKDIALYEIPESSCHFSPGDRAQARSLTGLSGDPAVLWVGHLNANKDPLTVLDGVELAARLLPGLTLSCCFGSAPLMRQVRRRIAHPRLAGRVRLLGNVPHAQIELLMRAADVLVLGSHRESTGYSVIEALACGLPPVVTDIPSFRALTGHGEAGALWPCGDPQRLCTALQSMATGCSSALRAAARARFERALSPAVLGARLSAAYHDVAARGCLRAPRLGACSGKTRAAAQRSTT